MNGHHESDIAHASTLAELARIIVGLCSAQGEQLADALKNAATDTERALIRDHLRTLDRYQLLAANVVFQAKKAKP